MIKILSQPLSVETAVVLVIPQWNFFWQNGFHNFFAWSAPQVQKCQKRKK